MAREAWRTDSLSVLITSSAGLGFRRLGIGPPVTYLPIDFWRDSRSRRNVVMAREAWRTDSLKRLVFDGFTRARIDFRPEIKTVPRTWQDSQEKCGDGP